MRVMSVHRETRRYYLTCGSDPHGRGILAIISLGSPQRGDDEITVCDMEVCKSMKAAKKWYRRQMKTRPWEKTTQVVDVPSDLGSITNVRAQGGKLVVDTESGTPMIVPLQEQEG